MSASANALRLGKAFVEFGVDATQLTKGLGAIRAQLLQLGSFINRTGGTIAGAGKSLTTPLTNVMNMAAERGSSMASLAAQFNETVPSISRMAAGFESAGISLGEFEGTLTGLQASLFNNSQIFAELGLSAWKLSRIPVGSALEEIAERISRMGSSTEQAVAAQEIFGSSWKQLFPYLQKGAAGIRELNDAGKGLELDPETAERGRATMIGLNQVWQQFRASLIEVGAALLPSKESIKETVSWVRTIAMAIRNWIKENGAVIRTVAIIGSILVGVGSALAGAGVTITGIAFAIGGAISIMTAFGSVLGGIAEAAVAAWPAVVGIGAAIGGLVAFFTGTDTGGRWWSSMADAAMSAFRTIKDGVLDLVKTVTMGWQGMRDAMSAGDLALAGQIAFAGLKLEWAKLVLFWTETWNTFKGTFVDGWHEVVAALKIVFIDLAEFIAGTITETIQTVLNAVADALEAIGLDERAAKVRGMLGSMSPEDVHRRADERRRGVETGFSEDKAKRDAARAGDADAAKAGVAGAGATFADLLARAKAEADAKKDEDEKKKTPDMGGFKGLASQAKGGFAVTATSAMQQFGVGDKVDRPFSNIEKNTKDTADKTRETKESMDKLAEWLMRSMVML